MVNRPLSSRDLELLSAFLDRQLSSIEQQRLEERLLLNPGLQSALDELRRTRAMLRSLPKVRAPRNFTLTPAMLPARRKQPLFGLPLNWSFASALAAMFLLVFFAGDFLGLFSPRSSLTTAERPSDALALETAMVQIEQQSRASVEDSQASEPEMPLAPENAKGMGGGGGDGLEATLQVAPMTLGTPQPSADQSLFLTLPTPTASVAGQPMLGISATDTTTSSLSAKSAPAPEIAFALPTEQAAAPDENQPAAAPVTEVLFTPWWVRLVEVSLLLVALGAALFAYSRRSR
jgi:hypothetical protein